MSRSETQAEKANSWRFKFAISAILIAFFLGVTLRKLLDFSAPLEKENVYNQVEKFKLGLTETWISRNIAHKSTNISAFENANPMILIAEVPKNYVGEYGQTPSEQKAVWYFDKKDKQLIYILNNGELLRFKLIKNSQQSVFPNGGLDLVSVE